MLRVLPLRVCACVEWVGVCCVIHYCLRLPLDREPFGLTPYLLTSAIRATLRVSPIRSPPEKPVPCSVTRGVCGLSTRCLCAQCDTSHPKSTAVMCPTARCSGWTGRSRVS